MKLSYYNYVIKGKDKVVVWNTASGALLRFKNDYFHDLENLNLGKLGDKDVKTLVANGIIIADEIDERQNIYIQRENKLSMDSEVATFTIALTEDCNARCYYCYQANECKSTTHNVTDINYDKIVDFLCDMSKGKKIKLVWFGGEPLLKKNVIIYICKALEKRKINYISNIITNGLLLSSLDINDLKNIIHINSIQVTFDGLFKKHDIRKGFYNKNDNFSTIVDNIEYLLKNQINVVVRVNISKNNANELREIMKFFKKRFGTFKNFKFYYELVTSISENNDFAIFDKEREKFSNVLFDSVFDIKNKSLILPRQRYNFCGAQKQDSYFIDIYGNLYLCEHHIWNKGQVICNIENFDYNRYLERKKQSPLSDKCKACVFLPVCQGGCVRNGENECPIYIYNIKRELQLNILK